MSRRRFHQPDSLEMLLDTMCNTFGGIILIALLVALISREATLSQESSRATTESAEITERRLAKAEDALAGAQAFQADLAAQASRPETARQFKLVEQRQELRQQQELLEQQAAATGEKLAALSAATQTNAVQKLKTLKTTLETLSREQAEERNKNEVLQEKVRELKQEVHDSETQLAQQQERQVRKLRLPREHQTGKRPWNVILRYGRVYPVHLFRRGQKEKNDSSITWRSGGEGEEFAEPNPGLGLEPESDAAALNQFFTDVPSREHYFIFQVYEDSFAAFNRVKEMAIRHGFELSWIPWENRTKLKTGSGEAPPPI
ncbi:MAG: hypothetical protein HY674_20760 [Chloroflexi bacterium]|nr:hypothetical protein [Chloroflexota bacterium]